MTPEENKIYDMVHRGTAEQVRALCCPLTGGPLHIQYCETSNGKRHLRVKGTASDFIMRMSGVPAKPGWVAVLGQDFVTQPSGAEPGASPNGGPAEASGSSGAGGGPPSVS